MFHAKSVYLKTVNCQSPVVTDYDRIVNVDEDGNEKITFVKTDYPKIQETNGDFRSWSLRSLMDAGIDPNFGIRTGFNTNLQAEVAISSAAVSIGAIVDSENKSE